MNNNFSLILKIKNEDNSFSKEILLEKSNDYKKIKKITILLQRIYEMIKGK